MSGEERSDARRLEDLWSGKFGDAYTARNIASGDGRRPFWDRVFADFPSASALEVGCNVGANLRWVAERVSAVGLDVNHAALAELQQRVPRARPVQASARALPFPDAAFDLVFTVGVLIHQSPTTIDSVMREIVRCARRYILCAEYFSADLVEVPYRGQEGALFKRDFGGLYKQLFTELALKEQGFLGRAEGWDDVTYWMFEKKQG